MPERKLENFFKFKEGANFNRRNTSSILRIALKLHCVPKFKPDAEIGEISSFRSGTIYPAETLAYDGRVLNSSFVMLYFFINLCS